MRPIACERQPTPQGRDVLHSSNRFPRRNRCNDFRPHLPASRLLLALRKSELRVPRRAPQPHCGDASALAIWVRGLACAIVSSACLVPSDRLLVQIDVDLFRLQIFLDAPGAKLAAETGLLVAAPRR